MDAACVSLVGSGEPEGDRRWRPFYCAEKQQLFFAKGKFMKKIISVVIVSLVLTTIPFIVGCGAAQGLEAAGNRDKFNKLEVGMTKEQLLKVMGKPYQREAEVGREWWLYRTATWQDSTEQLTPVCLEGEVVTGWGRNYYTERAHKYDIKVNQP